MPSAAPRPDARRCGSPTLSVPTRPRLAAGRDPHGVAEDADTTRLLGRAAARLHSLPADVLEFTRRIRDLPTSDAAAYRAGTELTEALTAVQLDYLPRCVRGFVHGDFSARNVLLAGYTTERTDTGHANPQVDHRHLLFHLAWRARWILQWAVEIDPPLTSQVTALAPRLLAGLTDADTTVTNIQDLT